jgi:hypothetical protein
MGGRAILIVIAGLVILSGSMFVNITQSTNDIATNGNSAYFRQGAKNIAQSGVNLGLRQLASNSSWRTGFPLMSALNGKMIVTAGDVSYTGRPAVQITSIGIMDYGASDERRDTSIAYVGKGFIPPTVKAAVTANNPVSTLGNLTVDGRDHATSGALLPGQGTLGIWTTKTLSQSGNSKIGGHSGVTDYPPAKPANSNSYATGQTWPGGYPGTPDSVLGGPASGYPEGTLKTLAQSHVGGGQYVTDPSTLASPLQGITYVELPSGGVWQSMNIQGSGILIVHNSTKNAAMKNLNSGTFTGLMIIDDPVHIHANIVGALIALTPSPSEGNCLGNGNGSVAYSSQAIINATGLTLGAGVGGSTSNVIAFWE